MTDDLVIALDERLAIACNTSDLTFSMDRAGDALILVAAGKARQTDKYVIGRSLIALEAEWDRSEQPRAPLAHQIEAMAGHMPPKVMVDIRQPDGTTAEREVPAIVAAKIEAERWFEVERFRLIARLKSFDAAHLALTRWADSMRMDKPVGKARGLLVWWLDHRCPKCMGTKVAPVPLGGRGAVRVCTGPGGCAGTGERPLPHGIDGRKMERQMIEARYSAIRRMKNFMQDYREAKRM